MAALGTVDMLLNLINFIQMSDPRLQYGLVIGESTSGMFNIFFAAHLTYDNRIVSKTNNIAYVGPIMYANEMRMDSNKHIWILNLTDKRLIGQKVAYMYLGQIMPKYDLYYSTLFL